jgi:imidazolonepropionase-like amidohydrolase
MVYIVPIAARCLAALLLLTSLLSGRANLQAQQYANNRIALIGARIYPAPGLTPIENGVVVIAGGKIVNVGAAANVKVPAGVKTIDCSGKTLVAGLWNTHVHFIEPKWNNAADLPDEQLTRQMQEMLSQYGFTSVVDTGSPLGNTVALRRKVTSGRVTGPRILTAGMILFPQNGLPYYLTESSPPDVVRKFAEGEVRTPEDAVRMVDKQIAEGADIVKLYVVTWLRRDGKIQTLAMPLSIVRAAAEEAHRKGKLVFAHPSTVEGVNLALAGHVDVLAHTAEDAEAWDDRLARRLKAAHVTLIPTLTLFSRDPQFNVIMKEVKTYEDIGGQIMFGTDVGFLPDHGALTQEYRHLAEAGLTFSQILAALTTLPASRLGFGDRAGRVQVGMDADLTLLQSDPAQDVSAFSHAALTIREGRIIYAAKTLPSGR